MSQMVFPSRGALLTASGCSAVVIVVSFVFTAVIIQDIYNFHDSVMDEMDMFKVCLFYTIRMRSSER